MGEAPKPKRDYNVKVESLSKSPTFYEVNTLGLGTMLPVESHVCQAFVVVAASAEWALKPRGSTKVLGTE